MSPHSGSSIQAQENGQEEGAWLDFVDLGNASSEAAHSFSSEGSVVVGGGQESLNSGLGVHQGSVLCGYPGEQGRIAIPLDPPATRLADLRFNLAVDPARQNYLTVKFWGEDSSPYKTLVMVNGEQAGYRTGGDYEPINVGTRAGLPGRFFHSTAALPLASTAGLDVVEITLRTYVFSYRTLAGETGFEKATDVSRRFFSAGTHTVAALPSSTLIQTAGSDFGIAAPDPAPKPTRQSPEEESATISGYRQWQVGHFQSLESIADAGEPLPIGRYNDDLRFYAEALLIDWSPASTGEEKRRGLMRIFASIDHYAREYYGNVLLMGTGGHQADWGGYYAALGEALYIVENLIADPYVMGPLGFASFLDEPFRTGTSEGPTSIAEADWDGGPLTRRAAWERVLKANFDFARSRLSYIYNQVMYTYEGAWKAHEGLRIIGSSFYQGRERSHRIVREFLGIEPFLGEEVLLAPDGTELDAYHSLFHHDGNAEYTDDYVQVIMKGLAISKLDTDRRQVRRLPYGAHYYGLTLAGLVRENGYVGVYGESTNYYPCWFFRTLGHAGDEALNDDILKVALKNLHARGFTRYQGSAEDGTRIMLMEQVIDDRNSDYPGRPAYGTDEDSGAALRYASLEEFMARNPERYAGPEWMEYREYAREATGYAQQQLLDGQFFDSFRRRWADRKLKYDLRIQETFDYVTGGRTAILGSGGAGRILPHADLSMLGDDERRELGIEQGWDNSSFAWVDIDNLLVSARDGDTHFFANLLERNNGFSGASRAHIQHLRTEQLLQFQADAQFTHGYVAVRGTTWEEYRQKARDEVIEGRPFALVGELLPVAHQPGLGEISRDNFIEDNPYSAYPELVTAQLGEYFIAMNTTRTDYGNRRAFTITVPQASQVDSVHNLVTGSPLAVREGQLTLMPLTAVVLKVGMGSPGPDVPGRVSGLILTPGAGKVGLSWKPVAGATAYAVARTVGDAQSELVASGIPGSAAIVEASRDEALYTVTALNSSGKGPASQAVPGAGLKSSDGFTLAPALIGSATDAAFSCSTDRYEFTRVTAIGFAGGDDAHLYLRGKPDSVAAATDLALGSIQLTARLDTASASAGLLLRENLTDHARYVFFGTDDDGSLVVRTRSLDTREDYGAGNAGEDASGGTTRSPYVQKLGELRGGAWPWLRLQRDAAGQTVTALVSADGVRWQCVGKEILPMPEVVHAGICTMDDAVFEGVDIVGLEPGIPQLNVAYRGADVELVWTKPRNVAVFDVYGADERGADCPVAVGLWQTSHVLSAPLHGKYKVVGRGPGGQCVSSAWLILNDPRD